MPCTCRFCGFRACELYMVKSSFGCAVRLLGLLKRYFEHIRNSSQCPKEFPRLFTVSYSAAEKILAVEYRLPNVERVVGGRAPRSQEAEQNEDQRHRRRALSDLPAYCIRGLQSGPRRPGVDARLEWLGVELN